MHHRSIRNLTIIASLAAIIYNSWPLGYALNPSVAHHSLASGFEAVGQPYNWIFISADVVSSLLLVVVSVALYRTYHDRVLRFSSLASGLFAVGTAASALLPERCVPNLMRCANFTQDHTLLLHGVFSIGASVFLFISLVILWTRRHKDPMLVVLLIGYIVFGMISLIQALVPSSGGTWSQDYYMLLCGLFIALLPNLTRKVSATSSHNLPKE